MTTRDILCKLTAEFDKGITSEVQVVYLLAGVRKLIERDNVGDQYPALKFHCDWALHASMDRSGAKALLEQFDAAYVLLADGIELNDLPGALKDEINRILQMDSFRKELKHFLKAYGLPQLTRNFPDGWVRFLHLYAMVIEDIPLLVVGQGAKYISHMTVNLEEARQTIKHELGEDLLFRVVWTIYDKNGKSGSIDVYNSFSVRMNT